MKRLGTIWMCIACSIFLLHSVVPHHHHCEDLQHDAVEASHPEDLLSLLSFMFHEDLGLHHLEHASIDLQDNVVAMDALPNASLSIDSNTTLLQWSRTSTDVIEKLPAAFRLRGPPATNV
jgi:hypothetical protein